MESLGLGELMGARRQSPMSDSNVVAVLHIGLAWIFGSEHSILRMKGAIDEPIPPSPADIDQQQYLENGMTPHPRTVA